jgi:murein DD-endopeptidase
MTCTAHLGRSLVREGDFVSRGQPIALSGYSGVDALVTFPFGLPHIHFNVWLNAEPVDPFPQDGKVSLWRGGELPETPPPGDESGAGTASEYSKERIDAGIACCLTAKSRARISAINSLPLRAGALLTEMNYYPTRFPKRVSPYSEQHNRQPLLDLPFAATDFDRVAFIDDL